MPLRSLLRSLFVRSTEPTFVKRRSRLLRAVEELESRLVPATLYWDTNGTTAGSGTAAGTWGTSSFWNTTDATGVANTFTAATNNASDVHFSAGAINNIFNTTANLGVVSVSGAQAANSITFDDSWPVTISGGTSLTLGGGGSDPGIYATIGDRNAAVKTISTPLVLGAAATIQNAANGELLINATTAVTGAFDLALKADSLVRNNTNNVAGNALPNNGGIFITGTVNNGGTLTNSGTGYASTMISGSIGTNVTKVIQNSATSPLVLSGGNSYTSGTNINAGILMIGNSNALGPSGAITFGGGTLNYGTQTTDYSARFATTGNNPYSFDTNNKAVSFANALTLSGSSGLNKFGLGTLTLAGANTYIGTTTIGGLSGTGGRLDGGTLTVTGTLNGTSGTALTFNGNGVFNVQEAGASNQGMGTLTFAAGDGTVTSTFNSTSATLTFSSLGSRGAGGTGNFIVTGGFNGSSNKIVLPGQGAGFIDRGIFFGGANYAAYDSGGNYVRALVYGSDANAPGTIGSGQTLGIDDATQNVQLTGAVLAQPTASLNTLNITGTSTLSLVGALSVNGILKTGSGTSTIGGGAIKTTAGGNELVIRTDSSNDVLNVVSPILANGTNTLTKSGAGTLKISGAYNLTGDLAVNSGSLALNLANDQSYGGLISGAGTLVKTGPGRLTLNGSVPNTLNGGLTVTNSSLTLDFSNMATPTNLINSTTPITLSSGGTVNGVLGGANILIKGKSTGDTTQVFTNVTSNAGAHRILVDPNGGASTTVVLGDLGASVQGSNSVTNGATYLIGKAAGAGTGSVVFLNDKASSNGPQNGNFWGGRLLWTNDGGVNVDYMYALQQSVGQYDMFPVGTRGMTYGTITATGVSGGHDGIARLTAADINGGAAGSLTLTSSFTPRAIKIENPAAGQSLNLGGLNFGTNYGLIMTGTNDFTISNGIMPAGANSGPGRSLSIGQYSTGTLTITAQFGSNDTGNSGVNFVKFGPGRLILAPTTSNLYNRSTYIAEGILQVGAPESATPLGLATGRTANVAGAGAIVFAGGTLQYSSVNQFDYSARFANNISGQQISIDTNGQTVTFSTPLDSLGGSLTLNDSNGTPGVLIINNSSTYTGPTAVLNGTLRANTTTAFNTNSAVTVGNAAGAILDLNGNSMSVGSLTGGGTSGGTVSLGSATLAIGGDNTSPAAYGGAITGVGGTISKNGVGTLGLSGTSTYSGGTAVNAGTLAVSGNLGNTSINVAAGATFAAIPGSSAKYAGTNATTGSSTLTLNAGPSSAAAFTMVDGAVGTFRVGSGGLTTTSNTVMPSLTFEIGNNSLGSIDVLNLSTMGGAANIAAGTILNFVAINPLGTLVDGDYTFMTATGGLSSGFTLASSTIVVNGVTYNLSLSNSTATTAVLTVATAGGGNLPLLAIPATLSLAMHRADTGTPVATSVSNGTTTDGHFTATSTGTDTLTLSPTVSTLVPGPGVTALNLGWASTSAVGGRSGTISIVNDDNGADTSNHTQAVTGGVYDYAQPTYAGATLAFGNVHLGASLSPQSVSFTNPTLTDSGYQDNLTVSAATGNSLVTAAGFSNLVANGAAQNLVFTPNTASAGSLASTVSLTLTSAPTTAGLAGGLVNSNLTPAFSITTTGSVFSGSGRWISTDSSWNTAANWVDTASAAVNAVPGTFAGFLNTDAAVFDGSGTTSVDLDVAPSLKTISMSGANYTLGGANTLTLSSDSGPATITAAGAQSITAPVALSSAATLTATGVSDTLTIGGALSGNGALTIAGSGTVTLTSAGNVQTGATRIASGTLSVGNANALQASTVDMYVADTGALAFATGVTAATLGGLQGSRSVSLQTASSQATTLSVGNNNDSTTYEGSLTGAGSLVKVGAGTLTVSAPSTYSGATIVSSGVLKLAGAAPPVAGYNLWLDAMNAASLTVSGGAVTAWANGGSQGNSLTGSASYSATGINGKPAVLFTGVNGATGSYLVSNSGSPAYENTGSTMTLFVVANQLSNGHNIHPSSPMAFIQGPSAPVDYGDIRNLEFEGTTLQAYRNGALSSLTRPANGSAYAWETIFTGTQNQGFLFGGVPGVNPSTGALVASSGNFDIHVMAVGARFGDSGDAAFVGKTVDGINPNVGWNGSIGEVLIYNTALSPADQALVRDYLNAKWFGAGAPSGGATNILPITTALTVSGGALDLGGDNQQVASLDGSGSVFNSNGPYVSTLTVSPASGSTTFSGVIGGGAGTINFVKSGAGAQVLTGINTYSGTTSVSGGTLTLSGGGSINSTSSITIAGGNFNASSTVPVAQSVSFSGTGGTLSGSGTVAVPIQVTSGNTLSPGNGGIGTLTVANTVNLAAGSFSTFEIAGNASANTYDKVDGVGGTVIFGGTLTVSFTTAPDSAGTYTLFGGFGSRVGSMTFVPPALPTGLAWHDFGSGVYFDAATGTVQIDATTPTVSGVTPFIGPTSGGNVVVIVGSGFSVGGTTAVSFGGEPAMTYTVNSSTQITAEAPANTAGTYDVKVSNGVFDSSTAGAADNYTYATPSITSVAVNGGPGIITPSNFPTATPTILTLSGATWFNGSFTISVADVTGLHVGQFVSSAGAGFPTGAVVTNVDPFSNTFDINDFTSDDQFTPTTIGVANAVASKDPLGAYQALGGQQSVVQRLVVTFNMRVTLDANNPDGSSPAFNVTSQAGSIYYQQGAVPSAANVAVTAVGVPGTGSDATGYSQYVLNFLPGSGVNSLTTAADGGLGNSFTTIADGLFQLNTVGTAIHAGLSNTAADSAETFWSLYGAVNPGDVLVTGTPGGGNDELRIDGIALSDVYATFGSSIATANPPYSLPFDGDLDGDVDGIDLTRLYLSFGTIWQF